MNNTVIEDRLYTYIGQCILDSITKAGVKNWELAILHIGIGNGVKNFKVEYKIDNDFENIRLVQKNLNNTIIELYAYTESNKYKKWNRMRFELKPNHQFHVDYLWDEEIEKNYQVLLNPHWK